MYKLISIFTIISFLSCVNKNNPKTKNTYINKEKKVERINPEAKDVDITNTYSKTKKSEIIKEDSKAIDYTSFEASTKGFNDLINTLDNTSIRSIITSKDFITKRLPKESKLSDNLFFSYKNFHNKICNNSETEIKEKYSEAIDDMLMYIENEKTKKLTNKLSEIGIYTSMEEGYMYLKAKEEFSYNLLKTHLSDNLNDYFDIITEEAKHKFCEDASMYISFDELADRVIKWEKYINQHPKAIQIEKAKDNYNLYLRTLLSGMDNTPVFANNKLLPEVKKTYEDYIKNYPNNKSTQTIKEYYKLLTNSKFIKDNNIVIYINNMN